MTNSSGAIVRAPGVAAPIVGDERSRASAIGLGHAHNLAAKAMAAGVDLADREGLTNAVICIAVMLACVVAYLLLARTFMA